MVWDIRQDAGGSKQKRVFCLQKTRSQKCTRMYIFDEVVAVGFNTLMLRLKKRRGIKQSARISLMTYEKRRMYRKEDQKNNFAFTAIGRKAV